MKLIKKNNKAGTINEAFKVGDVVTWNTSFFDGNVFRLDAFIKISTGKWALA
jgi:hypothetical protein